MRFPSSFLSMIGSIALLQGSAQAKDIPLPPFTTGYEPRSVDERGMWMEADETEKALSVSRFRIDDEELNGFVRKVLCDTVGQDRCNGVRIYVLDVPAFNATMAPNGTMTVWSGLLLRARSEAELGAVLGHEFGHFELRHSLQGFQNRRSTSDALAWVQVLGGIAQRDTRDLQINLIGSMFRFNRSQEKDADLIGLQYLGSSAYPSRSASEVWQHLMEEADATAAGRKVDKKHRYTAGFFDTHPTDLDRADYLLQESLKFGDSGDARAKQYYTAIAKFLPRFLATQVKLNDFNGTEYIISGIAATTGWTGELLQARADMFAARGNPRDLITATTLYLNAMDAGYRRPETLRGLGLSLVKGGQRTEGGRYLKEYLNEVPDAPDAKLIRMYIPSSNGGK